MRHWREVSACYRNLEIAREKESYGGTISDLEENFQKGTCNAVRNNIRENSPRM